MGGAIWSLLIWATAEGLGRTQPGEVATNIGMAIIYSTVFLVLLAANQHAGTRRYSLLLVIERRLRGRWRIAEGRR